MHHILHYTLLLLQHSSECGYLSRFAKLSGFIAVTTTAKVKTFAMVAKASRKICHQRMSFNVTTNFFFWAISYNTHLCVEICCFKPF